MSKSTKVEEQSRRISSSEEDKNLFICYGTIGGSFIIWKLIPYQINGL